MNFKLPSTITSTRRMAHKWTYLSIGAYGIVLYVLWLNNLHKEFIALTLCVMVVVAFWKKPTASAKPTSAPIVKRSLFASTLGGNRDKSRIIRVTLTMAQWKAIEMIACNDAERIGNLCSAALAKQANSVIQQGSQAFKVPGKPTAAQAKPQSPSNNNNQPPRGNYHDSPFDN